MRCWKMWGIIAGIYWMSEDDSVATGCDQLGPVASSRVQSNWVEVDGDGVGLLGVRAGKGRLGFSSLKRG